MDGLHHFSLLLLVKRGERKKKDGRYKEKPRAHEHMATYRHSFDHQIGRIAGVGIPILKLEWLHDDSLLHTWPPQTEVDWKSGGGSTGASYPYALAGWTIEKDTYFGLNATVFSFAVINKKVHKRGCLTATRIPHTDEAVVNWLAAAQKQQRWENHQGVPMMNLDDSQAPFFVVEGARGSRLASEVYFAMQVTPCTYPVIHYLDTVKKDRKRITLHPKSLQKRVFYIIYDMCRLLEGMHIKGEFINKTGITDLWIYPSSNQRNKSVVFFKDSSFYARVAADGFVPIKSAGTREVVRQTVVEALRTENYTAGLVVMTLLRTYLSEQRAFRIKPGSSKSDNKRPLMIKAGIDNMLQYAEKAMGVIDYRRYVPEALICMTKQASTLYEFCRSET